VREGAAEAMGACLQIIAQREKQMGGQAYEAIYEEAERGLKMNTVEAIHGSLMAVQELLQHSKTVSGSDGQAAAAGLMRLAAVHAITLRASL